MAPIRTFIAVELPPAVMALCRRYQQHLIHLLEPADLARAVRWTAPDKIHLTLRFLGNTDPGQIIGLRAALAALVRSTPPFSLAVGTLGCFPRPRAPSVLWLGVGGDLPPLQTLQSQIEAAAVAVGFPAEGRVYRPHLTIGRVGRQTGPADVRRLGELLGNGPLAADPLGDEIASEQRTFRLQTISHMESKLEPAGAVYSALYRVALRASSADAD